MHSCLYNFEVIRPEFEVGQEQTLRWLAKAHAHAEASKRGWSVDAEEKIHFQSRLEQWLFRVGSGPKKVQTRGTILRDFGKEEWSEMEIYNIEKKQRGYGMTERTAIFQQKVDQIFEKFYSEKTLLPQHLIHVSCTGYAAPSGAQKIVSKYQSSAIVTHAYHMGCYASIPAVRMAIGNNSSTDIVHTELCSLHVNPLLHEIGQLIVESLFADGFIKYSVAKEELASRSGKPYLRLLALHEEILPNTLDHMRWDVEEWGFKMFITKDIPVLIANAMEQFLLSLCSKAGFSFEEIRAKSYYAFHPGGPKILEQIASVLHLSQEQLGPSYQVLSRFGNMSSATLPHIWDVFLKDTTIQKNNYIMALAYGPGLTACGALFEKCGF